MPHATLVLASLLLVFGMTPASAAATGDDAGREVAEYRVTVLEMQPLRLGVIAILPVDGDSLEMSTTRPWGIPRLDDAGWPGIVTGLRAVDAGGAEIAATGIGEAGWRLARPASGQVTLRYEVDYSPLAELDWPAPRESAFVDADNLVLAGRSLFITTPGQAASHVVFEVPQGWHVATPWPRVAADGTGFRAEATDDLVDNLFAVSRHRPDAVAAGGFDVGIVAIGPWWTVRSEVRQLIEPVAARFVEMMPPEGRQSYLIVLLPHSENGGESFRNSFAMNLEETPTIGNRPKWGNTLAHELFHYWNGWRLRGEDYAATQWFQEGFTEYVANKVLLTTGSTTPADFLDLLSGHLANYRKLESTLAAPGTRKGPPLYSGGALVALCWDIAIQEASHGDRDIGDVFGELWRDSGRGAQPYDWRDIHAALQRAARGDWEGFYRRHVAGDEPLPIDDALRALGLRLTDAAQGQSARVVQDPVASPDARSAWNNYIAP